MPRVDMLGDEARAPGPRLLRSGVRPLIDRAQAGGIHVGVALGGRQRGVPEHLLDRAQISASLQEMRRSRVPQPVWRNVVHARSRRHLMHHRTHDARIDATALIAEEESVPAALPGQLGTASNQPMVEGVGSGRPVGNHTLFVSFADDPHGEGFAVQR